MAFKLGLNHVETPPHVPNLYGLVRSQQMSAPPTCDWHAQVAPDADPLGNDVFSDCLPVAEFRTIQIRRANAWGDKWMPTRAQVLARYQHLTGFNPTVGQPDDGCYPDAAMTDWTTFGIRLDSQNLDVPIWVSVPRRGLFQIKQCIANFGPVCMSFMLPKALEENPLVDWALPVRGQSDDWRVGSWGGHRVTCGKYDQDSFTIFRSWGHDIQVDIGFMLQYCVAVDGTLSHEWIAATGLSPARVTWDTLRASLPSVG